jgi:hypothetical protein
MRQIPNVTKSTAEHGLYYGKTKDERVFYIRNDGGHRLWQWKASSGSDVYYASSLRGIAEKLNSL